MDDAKPFLVFSKTKKGERDERKRSKQQKRKTYGFVFLVEIVDVTIQDLNEKLDRHRSVHTCIRDSKGALQALQDAFPVAIGLGGLGGGNLSAQNAFCAVPDHGTVA